MLIPPLLEPICPSMASVPLILRVTVGHGQQSQDSSAGSHSTAPGEYPFPEVPGTQVSLRIIVGLCSFPARWFLQMSSDML